MIALVLCLLFLFLSALCSGTETAFFSLSPFERKAAPKAGKKSKYKSFCLRHLSEILIVILLFNIFVNVGFSFSLDHFFSKAFKGEFPLLASTVIATLLLVLLGEILPKSMSYNYRVQISAWVSPFWAKIYQFLFPMVQGTAKFSEKCTHLIITIFLPKRKVSRKKELFQLLAMARKKGSFNIFERDLLRRLSDLHELNARDLMVARVTLKSLDLKKNDEEWKEEAKLLKLRWLPVHEEKEDQVVGLLDVFKFLTTGSREKALKQPHFVPETASYFALQKTFKKKKTPCLIVVDEYGGLSGIISHSDLLEEVVGNNEKDVFEDEEIKYLGHGHYLASGRVKLSQLEEKLHLSLENYNSDTLNGLISEGKGDFPKVRQIYSFDQLKVRVLNVSSKGFLKRAEIWRNKVK